jgi:hypothetical protein
MQDIREKRTTISPEAPIAYETGRRLAVGRVGWLLLLALILIPFAQSLPTYRDSFIHPAPQSALLSPPVVAALDRVGISLDTYAWISFLVMGVVVVFSLIVALALFWRRSDDWMALLVSLFIVIYTVGIVNERGVGGAPSAVQSHASVLQMALASAQSALLFALTTGVAFLFPSGRFVPRISWVVLVGATVWGAVLAAVPLLGDGLLFLGYPIVVGACVASIVYRYRRVSTPVERLQTRWIVAGFIVTLIGNQVFWLPSAFTPLGQTLYPPIVYQVYQLSLALVPISFFIAVHRYHLYNIDTIINRALVYGLLTTTLTTVYAVSILGTQALFHAYIPALSGQQPAVLVMTTLLTVALFRPLRAGIQAFIDRRFYRSKYDATQTLAAFAATLRSEVDLQSLASHLVATVDDVMQPAHVSLWLQALPGAQVEAKQANEAPHPSG